MHITELAKRIGTIPDQIRYLVRKKYIRAQWRVKGKRRVWFFSNSEVTKIELMFKYLNQGFRHDVAYEKATQEIEQPRLIE